MREPKISLFPRTWEIEQSKKIQPATMKLLLTLFVLSIVVTPSCAEEPLASDLTFDQYASKLEKEYNCEPGSARRLSIRDNSADCPNLAGMLSDLRGNNMEVQGLVTVESLGFSRADEIDGDLRMFDDKYIGACNWERDYYIKPKESDNNLPDDDYLGCRVRRMKCKRSDNTKCPWKGRYQ